LQEHALPIKKWYFNMTMVMRTCLLMTLTFSALAADSTELVRLREAVNAYRAGKFEKCAKSARGLSAGKLLNPDSALFIEAQCLFYARRFTAARDRFAQLSKNFAASPHTVLAAYRVADCDWELRDKRSALTHYQEAEDLQPNPPDNRVDRAVGLMHQAELSIERGQRQAGLRLMNELRLRFPSHPLAVLLPQMQSGSALSLAEALPLARALLDAGRRDEALEVLDRAPQPSNDYQRYEMAFVTGNIRLAMTIKPSKATWPWLRVTRMALKPPPRCSMPDGLSRTKAAAS
jgi:tetratricopeptide (TPR) repeat protein